MTTAIEAGPPRHPTQARLQTYFLRYFAQCGSVTEAATRAGIVPRTVQRWRNKNPAFARRYDEVKASRLELLEDLAMRRACSADRRAVFHRGKQVATVERHNDVMLMRLLTRFDRMRVREQSARRFDAEAGRREQEFEARVRQEVRKQLSEMSRSSGQGGRTAVGG